MDRQTMFASERKPSKVDDSPIAKNCKSSDRLEENVALEQPRPLSMNLLGQKGIMAGWSRETTVSKDTLPGDRSQTGGTPSQALSPNLLGQKGILAGWSRENAVENVESVPKQENEAGTEGIKSAQLTAVPTKEAEGSWFDRNIYEPSQDVLSSLQDALDSSLQWVWGVLQGDFNEDPSTSQIVVRTLLTLIPGLDQVADIQDLVAALYKLGWQQRYDDVGAWFGLFLTGIGLIPTLGSALKGIAKLLRRGGDVSTLRRLLSELADNLDNFSVYADEAATFVEGILSNLIGRVSNTASSLRSYLRLDITGKLSPFIAKLEAFGRALEAILAQVRDRFRQIGDELQQLLNNMMGPNLQPAMASGARGPNWGNQADDLNVGQPMRMEGGTGRTSTREGDDNIGRRLEGQEINWSPTSRPTFGHTFSRHGAGRKNTERLRGRAASTGEPQGQWLNNAEAADLLKSKYNNFSGSEPIEIDIPEGLGQIIMPDGSIVSTTRARLIPKPGGVYRTAFPIP